MQSQDEELVVVVLFEVEFDPDVELVVELLVELFVELPVELVEFEPPVDELLVLLGELDPLPDVVFPIELLLLLELPPLELFPVILPPVELLVEVVLQLLLSL